MTNPADAINLAASGKIDLLFLDVHMPEMTGLDVIRSISGKCRIILTTAYTDYAVDSYDLGVTDYLLKPISYPRFMKAVQKIHDALKDKELDDAEDRKSSTHIFVKTGIKNNVLKIDLNDIEYIESLKNYAAIYHSGKKTVAYLSMKDLEATLPADRFIRIHKSYIVSMKHINRIEGTEIQLQSLNNTRVAIGESYKDRLWDIVKKRTLG